MSKSLCKWPRQIDPTLRHNIMQSSCVHDTVFGRPTEVEYRRQDFPSDDKTCFWNEFGQWQEAKTTVSFKLWNCYGFFMVELCMLIVLSFICPTNALMHTACGEYGWREGGCIGSWWGNRREGDHWGDLGVDAWIILGWISRRWDVGIWTELGWPRIDTGGGRLWVWKWTFGFREMRGISWLASQEGLCTME